MHAVRQRYPSTVVAILLLISPLAAAERATLNESNWDAWAPEGKEVDCIYGDIVLRNDQVIAVIAQPIPNRNANMTVRNVGGMVIDLTQRSAPSDQLSAFYAGSGQFILTASEPDTEPHDGTGKDEATSEVAGDGASAADNNADAATSNAGDSADGTESADSSDESPSDADDSGDDSDTAIDSSAASTAEAAESSDNAAESGDNSPGSVDSRPQIGAEQAADAPTGAEVRFQCHAEAAPGRPRLDVAYRLADGEPWLHVECTYSNPHAEGVTFALQNAVRADRSFEFTLLPESNTFFCADSWWHQSYAIVGSEGQLVPDDESLRRGRPVLNWQHEGSGEVQLGPGENLLVRYLLIPAANTLQLHGLLRQRAGESVEPVRWTVRDTAGPIANAQLRLFQGDRVIGEGRTDRAGGLSTTLPAGEYRLHVAALGRTLLEMPLVVPVQGEQTIELELPGYVLARIRDEQGRRIPCKVEFRGQAGTPDPNFGPDTYEEGVRNLVYSAHGQFRQELAPGHYDVIVSHGPEFDAVFRSLDVARGEETWLEVRLRRSVETPGWISSDFHSHSSPSGDNTSSQRGRVLNLLCEHLEFAPCTEHNRISTYEPHLEFYQAEHLMATCSGMELTGQPLPVNHQNAFPLKYRPRTQDGGGPQTHENPVVQIERLALWDRRAEKVVQGNHPNLWQISGDRDLDGVPDGGFERMLASMDVVEVHPPQDILQFPTAPPDARDRGNPIFNWLQLLNHGYRIPGVVNTDAHYNFHGSGFLRNYLKSPADDPAEITTADMIRAAEAGNIVMTNGPYVEVTAEPQPNPESTRVTAGDQLALPASAGKLQLRVRVQCANWLDINRVFLLFNGRPDAEYDFRRRSHAGSFGDGVVKFEHTWPLAFDVDTHVVVVAVGEGLTLGAVVGPDHQDDIPIAVANPIFVDIGADGFQPNGDMLGVPLPLPTEPAESAPASP